MTGGPPTNPTPQGRLNHGIDWQTIAQIYGCSTQASDQGSGAEIAHTAAKVLAFQITFYPDAEGPVENAGVRIGEVIGWRVWTIYRGVLASLYRTNVIWPTHGPLKADRVGPRASMGIHAFKSREDAVRVGRDTNAPVYVIDGFHRKEVRGQTVVGRVALWGEVYEFEDGWQAEFARVYSLDVVFEWAPWRRRKRLKALRETYGVGAPEDTP